MELIEAFEDAYELGPEQRELLRLAEEHMELADELDVTVRRDGHLIAGYAGPAHRVIHPAITEARQQRRAAADILAALAPEENATGDVSMTEARTDLARKAAAARWGR
jgi:hypothetical protein